MPTISLCMITLNEERHVRRCLESARGFADEIIVVDTGSGDRTRAICESCGARVEDYKWAGDFSGARNHGIAKAAGEWILLLDADEELVIRDFSGITRYLENTAFDLIPIRMTHFYGNEPADERRAHFSAAPRLVRNNGAAFFRGRVHEGIAAERYSVDYSGESRRFMQIRHYGYMDGAGENKVGRNIALLLEERTKRPDDPWLGYHLAAEFYGKGRFDEAYREINTAIIFFLGKGIKPPALAYKLKYDMLIASGQYETAYAGIDKAIELYPDYVDLHFYRGILLFKHGEYKNAQNAFRCCLLIGEANMEHLILSGSGSFLPLRYIGLCHEKLGEAERAAEAFRQAEALCPGIGGLGVRFENPKP